MISYDVTLQVEPDLAASVEEHMRHQHIPAILATGCFRRIRFWRASAARFRTSYEARAAADLDRYLRDHAARFRAEFQAAFPRGTTVTRETWTEVESWGESPTAG